jgi:hypothetical protein
MISVSSESTTNQVVSMRMLKRQQIWNDRESQAFPAAGFLRSASSPPGRASRRYWRGVLPVAWRKTVQKYCGREKPVAALMARIR